MAERHFGTHVIDVLEVRSALTVDAGATVTGLGSVPASTGANKVLFDDGSTQGWRDVPTIAAIRAPTASSVSLQSADGTNRVTVAAADTTVRGRPGTASVAGGDVYITPGADAGAGAGRVHVRLPAGTDAITIDDSGMACYSVGSIYGLSIFGVRLRAADGSTRVIADDDGLKFPALPAADPHVAGQVWSNSGALTVSAG